MNEELLNSTIKEQAELDPFTHNAKSSVKISRNSRGITTEIKVVSGEQDIIQELSDKALEQDRYIQTQLNKMEAKTNGIRPAEKSR